MQITWSYVAGFFDGEGNISHGMGKSSTSIGLVQKEVKVLHDIMGFLKINGIKARYNTNCQKKRTYGRIIISAREPATKFLQAIYPFLIVKKLKAQDVLRFFKLYPLAQGFGAGRKKVIREQSPAC